MRVHHVGYLIKSMTPSVEAFQNLGYSIKTSSIYDADRYIDICFMENKGFTVELIAPRPECRIFRSLQKKIGNAPYHICYVADDFTEDMKALQDSGYAVIVPPGRAVALDNRMVVFMFHEDLGIIKLVES